MSNRHLASVLHYTSHQLYTLIFCCALAVLSACAQVGGKNYFPLSDGARWEYSVQVSTSSGKQYASHTTMQVDGETIIHGQRYFKFVVTSDLSALPGASGPLEDVLYYRVAPDGIYVIRGRDLTTPEQLEMPLPIPIGVKWLSGTTEVNAERVNTVEVGGRTYTDCLKLTYLLADKSGRAEYYLAPEVGIIKVVHTTGRQPPTTTETKLESYKL